MNRLSKLCKKTKEKTIKESFSHFSFVPELKSFLAMKGLNQPTFIQRNVIPLLLQGQDVLFADQTGTGKTFALLLTIINRIRLHLNRLNKRKQIDQNSKTEKAQKSSASPLALIISPTCELAAQSLKIAKIFSHEVRFSSMLLSKQTPLKSQKESLRKGPHLVIGTPGTIWKHVEMNTLDLRQVRIAAMDEVDVLFDRRFVSLSRKIKGKLDGAFDEPKPFDRTQFATCTSTLLEQNLKFIQKEFPFAIPVLTKAHHVPADTLNVHFIELRGRDKMESLLQLVDNEKGGGQLQMTLIFADTIPAVKAVAQRLGANGIEALELHHDLERKRRWSNLEAWREGAAPVLVASSLACRGIDSDCRHVILFDFPDNTTEYIHRVGRTARLGASGRVTALLGNADVSFARRIAYHHRKGEPIEGLESERVRPLKMSRVIRKGTIDHTSEFAFKPKRLTKTKSKYHLKHQKDRQLGDVARNFKVTNKRSGFKWFYGVESGRSLRKVKKSKAKIISKEVRLAEETISKNIK